MMRVPYTSCIKYMLRTVYTSCPPPILSGHMVIPYPTLSYHIPYDMYIPYIIGRWNLYLSYTFRMHPGSARYTYHMYILPVLSWICIECWQNAARMMNASRNLNPIYPNFDSVHVKCGTSWIHSKVFANPPFFLIASFNAVSNAPAASV